MDFAVCTFSSGAVAPLSRPIMECVPAANSECSACSHSHFDFLHQESQLQQCLSRVVVLYLIIGSACMQVLHYA